MVALALRALVVAVTVVFLFTVGVPLAVNVGNVFTPTGVGGYPWSTPALLTLLMQGAPFPVSTVPCLFGVLGVLVLLIGGLWAAGAGLRHTGRASILRLRFIVWWKSRPRQAPLTAKAAEPLGRVGIIGFFGIRWFTDMLEETRVLIAPTGAGKTVRLVVQMIFRAQGAIVATSTKPDVLILTGWIRMMRHPSAKVMAFDPEGLVPWMRGRRVKWDIVAGCEDQQMAMKRAAAIVAARPINGSESTSSGFFTQAVTIVLQCMLHAAAMGGKSMRDVMRWMGDFTDDTPYDILREAPGAHRAWEHLLTKYCRGKADETVSSTDMSASGILNAFSIEEILDSVCPTGGDVTLDVSAHHRSRDSLYLICKGEDSPAAAVFSALVESLYQLASADITRNGVCLPPMDLVLDEAMNICAIPSLPVAMSTGRGEGIVSTVITQDFQQIVERYGESKATTIVSNATELMVMGGLKDADYLQKIATLAGSIDQLGRGWAKQALAPERIRTLWDGRAVLFYRNQPPTIITLPPWWRSKHKQAYRASKAWAENEQSTYQAETAMERSAAA